MLWFLSTTVSEYSSIVTFAVNQGRDTRKQHNQTRSQEARMCHEQEYINRIVWSNKYDMENKEPKQKKIEQEERNKIAAREL